jgi:hypothetical protein
LILAETKHSSTLKELAREILNMIKYAHQESIRTHGTSLPEEELGSSEPYKTEEAKIDHVETESTSTPHPETPDTLENILTKEKYLPPLTTVSEFPRERFLLSPHRIKQLNREIARKIPPGTKQALIDERNSLVEKMYKEDLTRKEEMRLTIVRWQLDIIDDAEIGEHLDELEQWAEVSEKFAKEIESTLKKFGL